MSRKSTESTIDVESLRKSVRTLAHADDFPTATALLNDIAATIRMPTIAWAPDIARPHFDAYMDAFLRDQGWPDDMLSLWWTRSVMLSSPLYLRCRIKDLPFVSDPREMEPDMRREHRRVAEMTMAMGLTALITVPVHLPRGQIAMVSWCGALEPKDANVVLEQAQTELIAAARYFMNAFNNAVGANEAREEDLSRLTPREWDCLRLTAQGHREAEVGKLIGLASTTVRFHLDNVARKLGASNRTHAVAIAVQLGLLGPIGA